MQKGNSKEEKISNCDKFFKIVVVKTEKQYTDTKTKEVIKTGFFHFKTERFVEELIPVLKDPIEISENVFASVLKTEVNRKGSELKSNIKFCVAVNSNRVSINLSTNENVDIRFNIDSDFKLFCEHTSGRLIAEYLSSNIFNGGYWECSERLYVLSKRVTEESVRDFKEMELK